MQNDNYWTRVFRRRISRRRAVIGGLAAAAGTAAAAAVGCEPDGGGPAGRPGPGGTGAGQPRRGGQIVLGRATDPTTVDPHATVTALDITSKMYGFLYHVWPNTNPSEMFLSHAESVELPDPEHLEFIFKLKRGIKFYNRPPVNGREMTAEDVKFSFTRRSTRFDVIDKRFPGVIDLGSLATPDPYTFRMKLKRPFWPAINEVGNPTWTIAPVEIDQVEAATTVLGTGPWTLGKFIRGEQLSIVRHPEFFVPDRPYLDSLVYQTIFDQSSLLSAFQTGRHDVVGATLNPLVNEDLERTAGVIVHKQPSLAWYVLWVKVNKPPFNDPRVREAIDLALNRQELIDRLVFGEGELTGPVVPAHGRWALPKEELQQFYRHDPDRARALLEQAGAIGTKVRLKTASIAGLWEDTVTVVINQLNKVGFDIELQLMDLGTWLTTVLVPGLFDMTFHIHLPYDEPDRALSFYHSKGVTGDLNWAGYSNPEFDALYEKQTKMFNEDAREKVILAAQRVLLRDHAPPFNLFAPLAYTGLRDTVQGWRWGTAGPDIRNWDIWTTNA
ncbi:MAG: ABC transporter substrate-binding protein [Chloroflexi bacterium]|nr:ABC transporter substrate-binding protein [Chloroflexota bacterium]